MQYLSTKVCLREFESMERSTCYYFSKKDLLANFEGLKSLENDRVKFLFPVKSFPNTEVLKLASQFLFGFDVSNINEQNLISELDKKIVWNSSPFYSPLENSVNDINCLEDLGRVSKFDNISLRVSTDFLGEGSRFGVKLNDLEDTLAKFPSIKHLHLHFGGLENKVTDYEEMIDRLISIAANRNLSINFGGGFAPLSLDEIKSITKYAYQNLPNTTLYFEPGRWISASSGVAVGKVLAFYNKTIICSLSPTCHLRWIDNRVKIRYRHCKPVTEKKNEDLKVAGPSCYESDVLATIQLDPLSICIGDNIIVENVSGYSTAWNHSFNGIDQADIVFL